MQVDTSIPADPAISGSDFRKDVETIRYAISHDFGEPLRAMRGFASLLQRHCDGQLDEKASRYLNHLNEASERLTAMTAALNDYLTACLSKPKKQPVQLADIFDSISKSLDTAIDLEITTPIPDVFGDRQLIHQICTEILENAVKFSQKLPAHVAVAVQADETMCRILFRHNGVGIAGHTTEKMFALFCQLHPRGAYPGTGSGLAIARQLAQIQGGKLWAETSQSDPGVSIVLLVPCTPKGEDDYP